MVTISEIELCHSRHGIFLPKGLYKLKRIFYGFMVKIIVRIILQRLGLRACAGMKLDGR